MSIPVLTAFVSVLTLSAPLAGQLPRSADSAAWRAFRTKELQRESLSKWVRADSGSTHRSLEPVVALAIVGMPLGTSYRRASGTTSSLFCVRCDVRTDETGHDHWRLGRDRRRSNNWLDLF